MDKLSTKQDEKERIHILGTNLNFKGMKSDDVDIFGRFRALRQPIACESSIIRY